MRKKRDGQAPFPVLPNLALSLPFLLCTVTNPPPNGTRVVTVNLKENLQNVTNSDHYPYWLEGSLATEANEEGAVHFRHIKLMGVHVSPMASNVTFLIRVNGKNITEVSTEVVPPLPSQSLGERVAPRILYDCHCLHCCAHC